jgi:hypothetical protein
MGTSTTRSCVIECGWKLQLSWRIGVGGLIRDDKGDWLAGFSSNDGQGDVLFAELFAIYHGITLLLQHGHSRAIIESDSLEALQLLTRRNELGFHEYSSLLLRITSLIDHAPDLVLHHIFREANLSADWLAKYGNSSATGVTTWSSPPSGLLDQLSRDSLGT